MLDLNIILETILLMESANVENVNDAIDKKYRVIINYHTKGEDVATGARIIEVYAYGLTKAGNPVIRAFQPYGDTTSKVPSWKFFRLDRISMWKPTGQKFTEPASDYYPGLGNFNPNGDNSMSTVYKIAKFNGIPEPKIGSNNIPTPPTPKKANDNIYVTDTEKNIRRLNQQLDNPIYISDLKTKNSFDDIDKQNDMTDNTIGAKKIDDPKEKAPQTFTKSDEVSNLYKTDTERQIDKIRQQMANPTYVDQSVLDRYNKEKNKRFKK